MTLRRSNIAFFAVLLALSILIAAAARAQPGGRPARSGRVPIGAVPPSPNTPATAPVVSSDLEDKIIPEISFQNVSLDDMVAFLQDTVPHYKAVVFRDPDVGPDLPMVNIRLK